MKPVSNTFICIYELLVSKTQWHHGKYDIKMQWNPSSLNIKYQNNLAYCFNIGKKAQIPHDTNDSVVDVFCFILGGFFSKLLPILETIYNWTCIVYIFYNYKIAIMSSWSYLPWCHCILKPGFVHAFCVCSKHVNYYDSDYYPLKLLYFVYLNIYFVIKK